MGNNKSKARRRIVRALTTSTNFTERELRIWYKEFIKEYPDGKLERHEFNEVCSHFFPYGDTSIFSNFFFTIFDQNKDEVIDFDEFITAVSMTSRGTLEEKINWTFRLYDQDNDGYVTKMQMLSIVESIYAMVDTAFKFPAEENTPTKRVEKIFSLMDTDGDDILSRDEFLAGCKADGKILRALSGYEDIAN